MTFPRRPQRYAVHILAHADPGLFGDLVASLRHDRVDVYAHIDAKADQRPFAEAAGGAVRFVADRTTVRWGGFSQVRATLASLDAAGDGYHRHSLLSGADVLLRPIDEVVDVWSGRTELLRIDRRIDDERCPQYGKIGRFHFPDQPGWRRFDGRIPRRVPRQVPLMQGSTWWSLTGDAVRHLRGHLEEHPRWLAFFRFSHCPDEYVFHSVLSASPFGEALTSIGGSVTGASSVHGQHFIDWPRDGIHPNMLDEADLPRALASGALFARKAGPSWVWRGAAV
ncbi:beta-1,6-N-acetylglucosaminyltransferase [Gordonia sp. FQ]|uniref:beta-1,6-N-acetylglucosaminyltransferase n=1 Tax=Gordonia sp. FQ TaxID=3446634 RepID=UPI003F85B734